MVKWMMLLIIIPVGIAGHKIISMEWPSGWPFLDVLANSYPLDDDPDHDQPATS